MVVVLCVDVVLIFRFSGGVRVFSLVCFEHGYERRHFVKAVGKDATVQSSGD